MRFLFSRADADDGPQEKGAFSAQVQQVPSAKNVYSMRSETPSTMFNVPARMRRFVRGCDTRCAAFRLAVDDTVRSIRAEPLEGRRLVSAMIFADGHFYRFPLDRVGAVVKLDDLTRLGHVGNDRDGDCDVLVRRPLDARAPRGFSPCPRRAS